MGHHMKYIYILLSNKKNWIISFSAKSTILIEEASKRVDPIDDFPVPEINANAARLKEIHNTKFANNTTYELHNQSQKLVSFPVFVIRYR